MREALFWGLLAGSSILVGGLFALRVSVKSKALGLVMGFGSGVLISAVAYELVGEASATADGGAAVALGLFAGCGVFFGGDASSTAWGERTGRVRPDVRHPDLRWRSCSELSWTGFPNPP